MSALIVFGLLLALLLTGMPIAIALGLTVLTCLPTLTAVPLESLALKRFSGTGVLEIMAIPCFILAGNFPLHAGVARQGPPPGIATGTIVAAVGYGRLIPTSIRMVLYGVSTNSSVGALFIACVMPGLVLSLILHVTAWWSARRHQSPRLGWANWRPRWRAFRRSVWGLLLIVLLVGALFTGALTVTEAGALSAVYAFMVAVFIHKEMPLKQVPGVLLDSANRSAMLLFLLMNAFLFADLLTYENMHLQLAQWVLETGLGQVGFLLAVNLLLLIACRIMAPSSIILIAAPVLFPVAVVLGIDPILFGVMMVVSLEIGMITPPAGLNLCLVGGNSRDGVAATGSARLPWSFIMLLFLILIACWPTLSLGLPRTLGML